MELDPRTRAAFASDISSALGLRDAHGEILRFEPPRSRTEVDAFYKRLGAALDACRPSPHAPSLGALVTVLGANDRATRQEAPRAVRRAFTELTELFAQASFERTKRAERNKTFAKFVLLFDLERSCGLSGSAARETSGDNDPADIEAALRRVRKAIALR